jgi:capsular exopolysaccharide synthesis family protein
LTFLEPQVGLRTILISSSSPGEGKTATTANLGVALAQAGRQVLLVDADLRVPRLAQLFNLDQEVGLTNVLVGASTTSETIAQTPVPGLYLLPSGPLPPNPAELLSSSVFRDLLVKFKWEYDRVVIDTPPVLTVADAGAIAAMVDGILLVVEAGVTRRESLAEAKQTLEQLGGRVMGVVLNKLNSTAAGAHYNYYRYYGPADMAQPRQEQVAASGGGSAPGRLASLGRWGQQLLRSLVYHRSR